MANNFQRMIQLVNETFDTRNDPEQLDVNEEVIEYLFKLHPATLSEHVEGDGPVVWILVIPTTTDIMNRFLNYEITEHDLLYLTPLNEKYDALYLCSASVLDEFRRKGLAKKMTLDAIEIISKDHPIKNIFVWHFSAEGEKLAENIAKERSLPLLKRKDKPHTN